jgi:hypothetical protein
MHFTDERNGHFIICVVRIAHGLEVCINIVIRVIEVKTRLCKKNLTTSETTKSEDSRTEKV